MDKAAKKPTLDELLERQNQLIRRDQLLAHAVSPETIRWRIRRGTWQRVLTSVYATFSGAIQTRHRLVAAILYGGPGSQITGEAALRWHGFRSVTASSSVQLLVPHASRRASTGFVVVTRTTRPDPMSRVRPALEVCSVARAVADTARTATELTAVRAIAAEAVQRRLATVRDLFDELDAGPMRGSALMRTALSDVAAGARSAPEAELRSVLSASPVLPTILWNPRLTTSSGARLPTPDGWIPDVAIALEVDSREYHLSPEGWQRTIDRHNVLTKHSALVLHFTPAQLREPAAVLATVEQAYTQRAAAIGSFTAIRAQPTT